jgi:redox-sensitive bicupin YhaK (pirin superfamily)
MFALRRAQDRGHANHGWLNSYHTFSFGDYYDPRHLGVSNLRVINDDTVAPGGGFSTHGHRDMEIVSYVLAGALEHKDSMGNGSVIRPGDVQLMSAGTGVRHSEYNHSATEPVHFLQIWLQPNETGIRPGYDQRYFAPEDRQGRLALLVSPDGRDGSMPSHQDALLYGTLLRAEDRLRHELAPGRIAYVHLARGSARVNGELLEAGDGAAITDARGVTLDGIGSAELLLFDLP